MERHLFKAFVFLFCFIYLLHINSAEEDDDSKLDDYINSLPENVFDQNFDGDEDEFNAKIDELLKDYQSKLEREKMKTNEEDESVNEPLEYQSLQDESSKDQKDESKSPNMESEDKSNDPINENKEDQPENNTPEEEIDDRPVMDENADPSTFYPIMSDEEFREQERRDMDELAKREEPEPRIVEDEETLKKFIDDAFREQSFDENPLVVESDFEEAKKRDEIRSDEWPKPGEEYTGSDIVDVPNDEEFSNLHMMSSMGKVDDPFKTSFQQYDEERKARSQADMEADLYE